MPIVLAEGEARERGREHGAVAREQIGPSVERYMERFQHFQNLTPAAARRAASSYVPAIKAYDPEIFEEITGIAEGSGLPREDILAVNCRSELMFGSTETRECTSFGLQPPATANGQTYVGQNWDWAPECKDALILLIIRQQQGPTVVLLDEAGMVGRMGLNTAGIGLVTNTLISNQSQAGVPYNVVLRGILNATSMATAIAAVVRARRAISANFLIGDGGGQVIDIEASPDNIDYIGPENGIITHGNHFAGRRFRGRDMSLERFPDSLYRECRLRDHLASSDGAASEDHMISGLKDSFGHPNSVSRECDPAAHRFDQMETVASIIMNATTREFLVLKGTPAQNEYSRFSADDLAQGKVGIAV